MTFFAPADRNERRRRRRRQEVFRWGIAIGVGVLLFLLGVALGEALHDNPKPGSTVTLERTLRLQTTGAPRSTVTP